MRALRNLPPVLLPASLFIIAYFVRPFVGSGDHMRLDYVTDDFYYYAVIADHFAHGAFSTFDGVIRTNGYHPLWLAVVTVLRLIAGGTGGGFFALLFATLGACCLAASVQLALLFRAQRQPAGVAAVAVLMFAVGSCGVARTGMEVALALPLAIAHIAELDRIARGKIPRWWIVGLLASLTILARIDMVMLVALTWLAVLPPLLRRGNAWRALAGLAFGLLPVLAYFVANWALFGSALPISADAKALAPFPARNFAVFGEIYWPHVGLLQRLIYPLPAWCAVAVGIAGLLRGRWHDSPRRLVTAICVFPPVFYAALALRSDWVIWFWYLYPVILAAPFAIVTLFAPIRVGTRAGIAFATALAALVIAADYNSVIVDGHFVRRAAIAMLPFTSAHAGRYAMGDRAGLTAFVTGRSMLQLEGIVGDPAMLARIRQRGDLLAFLRAYRIDYYIATDNFPTADVPATAAGCYAAREPKAGQAGPRSPAMTAEFCAAPLYRQDNDGAGLTTLIFAVPPG